MKRLITIFATLMAFVTLAQAQDFAGTYVGRMDSIQMNDKRFDAQDGRSFTLSTANLTGTVSKIGSMPGTIYIDMPIAVDASGNIKATPGASCGKLKLLGLISIDLTLTSLTPASAKAGTLDFYLVCTGSCFGKAYVAKIHFRGVATAK